MMVSSVVLTVLLFLVFGVLWCSAMGSRKRSRFYSRIGYASLAMSILALALAISARFGVLADKAFGLLWIALLLAALVVAPVLCYRPFARFGGSSDADDPGGSGPGGQPPRPDPPRGGTPLPDADQARARKRDHNRPPMRGVSQRRPAAEPAAPRVPARTDL